MIERNFGRFLVGLLGFASVVGGSPGRSWATFPLSESFRDATAADPGWILSGNAVLTGTGSPDPVGQGWLRLTSNANDQAGTAIYNSAFSSSDGVVIEFDYAMYGGTGADGISFYLIDGTTTTPTVGAPGGGLGYSHNESGNPGVKNGYVGVGFDRYGNFSSFGYGDCNPSCPGAQGNSLTIRGSGNLFSGFNYLTRFLFSSIGQSVGASRASARPVQIVVANGKLSVRVNFGSGFQTLVNNYNLASAIGQAALPATLKMGISASTGGSTNFHEIRNFTAAKPARITMSKVGDKSAVMPGDALQYELTVSNDNLNDVVGATIHDVMPSQLINVTWTCSASPGSSCAANGTDDIDDTVDILKGGTLTYTIDATVAGASAFTNTATIDLPEGLSNTGDSQAKFSVAVTAPTATATATQTSIPTAPPTETPTSASSPTAPPTATQTPTPTGGSALCPASPASCTNTARKGQLRLNGRSDSRRNRFAWRFNGGPALQQGDFGDPTDETSYAICLYDNGVLKFEAGIPATPAQWRTFGRRGYTYFDRAAAQDGIRSIRLRGGAAGRSKFDIRGRGSALPLPAPVSATRWLDATNGVLLQFRQSDGTCYESSFAAGAVKRNSATKVGAKF